MSDNNSKFVFEKKNYVMMAIGFAIVIIGFMLMAGGKSEDPNAFNPDEIFSHRRITLAPLMVLIGFAVVGFGIMLKTKTDEDATVSTDVIED
ncbi:MAG: DUF3098 domain-containing protein [Flavobacteriales bacterium]|nr:DUF3098 domain-containing protein [Flavobacteriales bacterium]|tara:strand:+ start:509 stop:784 length:276 start_codon:yes stop_codon:yes gene_type:complete